jgi:hypothetical protein
MLEIVEQNPSDLILVLADMARTNPSLSGAFLAEFTRHLQGQSPHIALATTWIEHRVAEQGLTIERLVQAEGQGQAADQVSIGNSITSLRFLSSTDWRDFVESQSVVERILCTDPAQVYAGMDFVTRDHYRHAVEQIAKRSSFAEQDIASEAIKLAATSAADTPATRASHVGFHLIDRGRSQLQTLAQMRRSPRMIASKMLRRWPLLSYLVIVLFTTIAVSAAFVVWLWRHGSHWTTCLIAAPVLFCASQLGVALANWLTTLLVKPRALARMDFSSGIPREHRTIVVVPTMLGSAAGVERLLEGL